MKIKFLDPYQVKDAGGKLYLAGEVVELSEASARHFLRRSAAEVYAGPDAKEVKAAAAAVKKEEKAAATAVKEEAKSAAADAKVEAKAAAADAKAAAADVPPDKDLGGETDPVKTFTAAQAAYVAKVTKEPTESDS